MSSIKQAAEEMLLQTIIPFWKGLRDEENGGFYGYMDFDLKLDKQAEEQLALTVRQMQEAEGVTEALKAADQLEWVRRMNSIRNRAEEIIKSELIFV